MQMIPPQRIQLSRTKGFDLQSYSIALNGLPAINCARPFRWSNPFAIKKMETGVWCVRTKTDNLFHTEKDARYFSIKQYASINSGSYTQQDIRRELRGKNLACWCKSDEPCHCDYLLRIANAPNISGGSLKAFMDKLIKDDAPKL
jgi:hypothetical protein